ncbi:DUF6998 domain-containing protein [Tritonibacter scottomollicae]|uniref:DUF6998 domain-containing protein n=1 Tax=Tritonibacter scottomollicae TaxID=483013 RepID=UPI003AA7E89F
MSENVDWARVAALLDDLYTAADGLKRIFPGRKFTLDGHLVGRIGEVVAACMFDLSLNPASTHGHDARARDGPPGRKQADPRPWRRHPPRTRTPDRPAAPRRQPGWRSKSACRSCAHRPSDTSG